MIILKAVFSLLVAIAGLLCLVNSRRWSVALQVNFINSAKQGGRDPLEFTGSSKLILFRIIVIFFGVLLLIAAYPISFGPLIMR